MYKNGRLLQLVLRNLVPVTILLSIISGCTHMIPQGMTTEDPMITQEPGTPENVTITEDMLVTQEPTSLGGHTIAEIQGTGHFSLFENQDVEDVHGIVTVIRADGFYLQSLNPDDDSATSEGIYVYQGLVPSVRPGDEILVSAQVRERVTDGDTFGDLPITQLRYPTIEVLSKGNRLPEPVIIGDGGRIPPTAVIDDETQGRVLADGFFDPVNAGLDFYESLEGMLVQVNNAVVVGPTSIYKEIVILADMGSWAGMRTPRGGIVVREGDFNPERIILDDALREMPFVQVGDYAPQPIIGVMDYTFGNYKLQPIHEMTFNSGDLQSSDPLALPALGEIRVASYNVGILSALDKERMAVLAEQIVIGMASPEMIGLQEIADNDGSLSTQAISADETYLGIIAAIQALGGPPYGFVDIDPLPDQDGGVPGGNVRVGFLYRLDRGIQLAAAPRGDAQTAVSVTDQGGRATLSINPGRIDPLNSAFTNSRKPLVVTFLIQGEQLVVINNHFNSKGPDQALFGAVQPPVLHSEAQRTQQAQIVHDFVASILAIDPNSRVIVLGDLNDFHFSMPIQILKGEQLDNLITTLPDEERYTYIYDGNSQVLDHILVSESLKDAFIALDILHFNSEFDYWRQFSDHDPLVATFVWE